MLVFKKNNKKKLYKKGSSHASLVSIKDKTLNPFCLDSNLQKDR